MQIPAHSQAYSTTRIVIFLGPPQSNEMVIGHFLSHAQNKVRVPVGGLTRFVNMTD